MGIFCRLVVFFLRKEMEKHCFFFTIVIQAFRSLLLLFVSSVESRMSRIKHLAAYMFRTLTVRNVRRTRKSKISRLTRLRLLHYPKTNGMSCASSVEI